MSEIASQYDTHMHILEIVDVDNMVEELDDDVLTRIGTDVVEEYLVDKGSMKEWDDRNDLAKKLIDLKPEQVVEPWSGAANAKLPLVLNAAMKASAEETAEITRDDELVKIKIFGKKTDEKIARGERVAERMNHQFYHELPYWEEDHDKLVLAKNIMGTVHKKLFFSDGKIQCILRRNGLVINDNVERLEDAPRVTDILDKFWWQAEEKVRSGDWVEVVNQTSTDGEFAPKDKETRFLEQLRREDLDGDGYPEPYIVTVHEETGQVVRITPNFTPESITFKTKGGTEFDPLEYAELGDQEKQAINRKLEVIRIDGEYSRIKYIKYEMLPSWEGGYWSFGYGMLLGPLNENCNKLVNQLLNQGHLQSQGGGFINSGIKMGKGERRFRMNEFKSVSAPGMDLSRNIVPLPVKEPSQTLFSLLGLLMEVLKDLSSVTDVMSGEAKPNMAAASIDMLITQGQKMFNSIYIRHYRSLSREQRALFDLNSLYQSPKKYIELLDLDIPAEDAAEFTRKDFSRNGIDIIPTANPQFSSKNERRQIAAKLMEVVDRPETNSSEIVNYYIRHLTDDAELTQQVVAEQPNLTPQQQQEQSQQQMQEFLQGNEAKISESNVQEAEMKYQISNITLQMKQAEAEAAGIKAPMDAALKQMDLNRQQEEAAEKARESASKAQQADANADKAKIEADKALEIAPYDIEKARLEVEKAKIAKENEKNKDKVDFEFKGGK